MPLLYAHKSQPFEKCLKGVRTSLILPGSYTTVKMIDLIRHVQRCNMCLTIATENRVIKLVFLVVRVVVPRNRRRRTSPAARDIQTLP